MKYKTIKILGLNDLSNFIKKANEVKGDVLVYRGKFVVDGKSIMGMMSIDVSDGCKVEYPDNATDFEQYLENFEM